MIKISSALYALAILLLFSGVFYSIEFMKLFSLVTFSLSIFLFILFPFLRKKTPLSLDFNGYVFLLFILSFFVMLASAILNKSLDLFVGILLFMLVVINFSIFKFGKTIYDFFDIPIKLLFWVITLLNISFGVSIPFNGAFSNPNSLGGVYAMISFIATGVLLDKTFNSDGKKIDYILLVIVLLSTVFTLISNSRISFISSCLCLLSIFSYYLYNSFNSRGGLRVKISFFKKMIGVFFLGLLSIVLLWGEIKDIFIKKVLYKIDDGGGVTGGRNDVWGAIFDNSLIFGHGRNSPHLDYFDLAAHNTFLSIYDQFGWLSCILFIISIFLMFINFFSKNNLKIYGITPFFILFGFVFLSISESMINKTIMFCFLMLINLSSFEKRNFR